MCYITDHRRERGRMVSEAQKRAKSKYDAKTVQYVVRLRLESDADVIQRLRRVQNKTDYLRKLVREDIKREE